MVDGIGISLNLSEITFHKKYTCCIEIYIPDIRYDNEFNSANLSFQGLNILLH